MILLGPGPKGIPTLAGRLPVTVIGWHVADPSVDVVRTSDDDGIRCLIEHLIALGHRNILDVDGGPGPVAATRRRAYRAQMRRHSLTDHIQVLRGGDSLEDGARAARLLLESPQPRP